MSWEVITTTATAVTASAGAIAALYKLGQQLGLWRALRQLGKRKEPATRRVAVRFRRPVGVIRRRRVVVRVRRRTLRHRLRDRRSGNT